MIYPKTVAVLIFLLNFLCTTNCQLIISQVPPASTDQAIDDWTEDHYIFYNTDVSKLNILFVHLDGSYGIPGIAQKYLTCAANVGFHVVNLRYPNSWTVNDLCRTSEDEYCFSNLRMETLIGDNKTSEVNITRSNSIENRLIKLLQYLHSEDSEEGWDLYFDGDNIMWDKLGFSGHSQGAGHASFIGYQHNVHTVLNFASPADYSVKYLQVAPWLSEEPQTTADHFLGFGHLRDQIVGWDFLKLVFSDYLQLSQFGEEICVDNNTSPYSNSHMLFTDCEPSGSDNYHGSIINDKHTPLDDNDDPILSDTWIYLLTKNLDNYNTPTPTATPNPNTSNAGSFSFNSFMILFTSLFGLCLFF
ncbi:hypothetical protein M0812_14385 [Anaeramoeba flamelloides]|uniref:Uncharacterized protein n=1 Tax=Anaeramoeba flamelloides TaxID=1746091 RepID=A0AAV7ZFN0_9EUKA|nr:hypothetical protein M0812_14385 [Anaeramoeba flamelloides]